MFPLRLPFTGISVGSTLGFIGKLSWWKWRDIQEEEGTSSSLEFVGFAQKEFTCPFNVPIVVNIIATSIFFRQIIIVLGLTLGRRKDLCLRVWFGSIEGL